MTPSPAARLGIDFGTTHTVAVLETPDGRIQPLLFDSSPLLSSAVYAEPNGQLLTGRDGERSARLDPTRYEPNPKRRIDDTAILLGSDEIPIARVIGAVLDRVAREAVRAGGGRPAQTVLTYPATWGPHRKDILAEAAGLAGLTPVTMVPEPVAAAAHFTGVLGRTVVPGAALAIYDFGGGTFDASVVRRRPDGAWELVAFEGLTDVGGLDLDAALVDLIGRSAGVRDPQRWRQLLNPTTATERRAARTFWDDVRAAKEQLSRTSSAALHLPLFDTDTHLTREEFEAAARPLLYRTVDVLTGLLGQARLAPGQLAGLYLVGGSSRIPLIATLLHQRIGLAPVMIDQPELLVAHGSLRAIAPPGPQRGPLHQPPMNQGPIHQGPMNQGPVHQGPTHTAPMPVAGWQPGVPVSGGPPPNHPVSGLPTPGSPAPGSPPPHGSPMPGSPMAGSPMPGSPMAGSSLLGAPVSAVPGGPVSGPPGQPGGPVSPAVSGDAWSGPPTPAGGFAAPPPPPGGPVWPSPPPAGPGAAGSPPGARPMARSRTTRAVVLAVALVVIIAGCYGAAAARTAYNTKKAAAAAAQRHARSTTGAKAGSGATAGNDGAGSGATNAAGNGGVGEGVGRKQQVAVNRTIWCSGSKYTIVSVTYDPAAKDTVQADVTVENLSKKSGGRYDDEVYFRLNGQVTKGDVNDMPSLPGKATVRAHLAFDIKTVVTDLKAGELIIGDADKVQAVIPIGDPGKATTLEPLALVKTPTTVTAKNLTFAVTGCELRADIVGSKTQAAADSRFVSCVFDVTLGTGGGSVYSLWDEELRLKVPDGTVVAPVEFNTTSLHVGATSRDVPVSFKIRWPAPGAYAFQVHDGGYLGDKPPDAQNSAEVPLTVS